MRTVLIRVEGEKRRVLKLQLREGVRVSDILQALHVPEDYILARTAEPSSPLPYEAAVHALCADGEHLIAHSRQAAVEDTTPFTLTLTT
jgi:hypothetical protein